MTHPHNPDHISFWDYEFIGGIDAARDIGMEALTPVGDLVEWAKIGETLHDQITTGLLLSTTPQMRADERTKLDQRKIIKDMLKAELLNRGETPEQHTSPLLASKAAEVQTWVASCHNPGVNMRLSMASRRIFVKALWQEIHRQVDAIHFDDQYDRLHYIASLAVDEFGHDKVAVCKQGINLTNQFPTMNRIERHLSWRHRGYIKPGTILGDARTRIFDNDLATKTITGPRTDLLVAEMLRPVTKDHDKIMVVVARRTRLRRLQTCITLHLMDKYFDPSTVRVVIPGVAAASIVFYNTAQHVKPIDRGQMERTAREIVVAISAARSREKYKREGG